MPTYRLTSGTSVLRLADGASIPADVSNRDYWSYTQWLAAGNTPDPAPIPPPPTEIPAGAFLDRFTPAEQQAVQQAAQASPAIALGLTMGLARGSIDLQGSFLSQWMQGLVDAHVLTPARALEILTP
jgi:hypothetical protein